MNKIKIICTLGPSSFSKKVLNGLKKESVDILRINMSHTNKEDIQKKINLLVKNKVKNICLDTEGAQIRTTYIDKEIFYKKNVKLRVYCDSKKSNKKEVYLNPLFDIGQVKKNTNIFVGFNNLELKVTGKKQNYLECRVIKSGILGANKGVHINSKIGLDSLTSKDKYALSIVKKNKIKFIALSFVNSSSDVVRARKIVGSKPFIISKIETKNAIKNLKHIARYSDALLIDRGDLSREISIEHIPIAQERIIKFSKKFNIPVYVATNLLETMIKENYPTRAESHDIYSTLKQGASGMVLAAETAIGNDPINCVKFLKKCIRSYKNVSLNNIFD